MGLKNKIKQWLFKDEIELINDMQQVLDDSVKTYNYSKEMLSMSQLSFNKAKNISEDALKLMNSICDVGVDVHMHPRNSDYSWAVICAHGKMDYVKFIPLQRNEVMEVAHFLKRFEYSPRCVDTPWGHKRMIDDLIVKM